MNKNKLRNIIVTLIVAIGLIGMIFGAAADYGNVSDAPEPKQTISIADASVTSMHDNWHYRVGRDMSEDQRLNRINPDRSMIHPERFERFSGHSNIGRDGMPDLLIDSRMNRRMPRTGMPDRSAPDRLVGKNMAYPKVSDSDIPLVMSAMTSPECSFTYGITAGDLNGDDRDDVLVFSGTHNSTTYAYTFESVSALNGDGTELWRQSIVYETSWIGDIPAHPVGDLDGDNKGDVIVESQSYDSGTDKTTASVYAKRGYDGYQFWSQSVTGEDVSLWAYSCCDLDGDDKDDVIVNSQSYDSATDEYTASMYVKRGYDGYQFWSQSVTGDDVSLWASSYCDLDGDDKDEVIVVSQSYDSGTDKTTASVYAKRGYDGHQFWSQSVTGDGWYGADMRAFSYCDLDGDDKDDVIVVSQSYDSGTDKTAASVYAKRGYDGYQFWSQSVTGDGWYGADMEAFSYCDLDGDDKDDMIVESRSYDSATDEETASVYVKRGYDGYQFWSQSVTGEDVSIGAFSYCDLDGDDKDDVIVESQSYDSATDEETASVYAKRGYDGHQFWSQSVTGDGWYGADMWASSYCDLDGDDKDDVIVESRSCDSATDEYTASVHVKRGYDGHQFWSQSVTGEGVSLWASSYCDLDGDDKDDVIVESQSYDSGTNKTTASVYAKRGYDGHQFWSQSVTGDGWYGADMEASSYCDLDGDDKDDVIVESQSYDSATDEETASVYAKRGYDGHQFWSQSVTGEDVSIGASSYCDLDGDDKDDVIVESQSYDSATDEETASVYAKRGYDGHQFWSQSVTGEDVWLETDYYNWYYYSSQDFDGDSLEDVLITTGISSGYNKIPTKVCAVKGNDGTSLWCKSSAPTVTGDLNGDGKLTPADAVIVLNIAVSGDYNEYADVNDDGVVNSLDVLMILQAAASLITI